MRLTDAISLRSRRRKLALFMETIRPSPETTVLDVGADELGFGEDSGSGCGTLNFFEEHYPWPDRITALGLHPGERFRARYPAVTYVQGDALSLPFADGEFDVVFSNAVIEHVGGLDQQRRFVEEALRVARRAFVTTPNRWFPIETHTLVPFVHWLPRRPRDRLFGALRREAWEGVELLTRSELVALFPSGVEPRVVESRITISVAATRTSK